MSRVMTKIFVYGTLKNGFPNYYLLENPPSGRATFMEVGQTKEKYPLVIGTDANIPFMLRYPGTGENIKGEIYEVDEEALGYLDRLEGHPTWYRRLPCQVVLSNSHEVDCETYFLVNCKKELLDKELYNEFTQVHAGNFIGSQRLPRTESLKAQVQNRQ